MRLHYFAKAGLLVGVFLAASLAQRGFREYPYEQNNPAPVPPDANEKTEWAFGRLRYTNVGGGGGGFGGFGRRGGRGGRNNWATDFPKADRQFVQGVRRLTRVHVRSSEQVVDLDLDDTEIFFWPWVYTLEVGRWNLSDKHVDRLREYLLRGGFLMIDDFHGTSGWEGFLPTMSRIFPDRPIVELDNKDAIFHVLYDLDDRVQVAGISPLQRGVTYEQDGYTPHWRGIYDDHNRLMVAICYNQDYGDAWEWADAPWYPEKMTSQAYRLGINYIIYAMTH